MNSPAELLRLQADRQTDGHGEIIATMFVHCTRRRQYKTPKSIDINTMYWLIQSPVKGTVLKSDGCLSYRMRVMKAGVKSRLDDTPKSECLTSSHVEYLMREQAGDGKAATE